jgi:SAM-dependent methyltransferase
VAKPIAPDGIFALGFGFWGSRTLLSAVELGVFAVLATGPAKLETLQARLGLHARGARDFLDALVSLGMLERSADLYRNTPETDLFLDPAKPSYVGGILEMMGRRLFGFWSGLTEALRTGLPQNEAKNGGPDVFKAMYSNPVVLEGFLKAMTGISRPAAGAIAAKFPWRDHRSFADLGCAQGGAAVEIANAHPHLTGTGFDLPQVRPIYERYVAEQGLAGRLRFQPGDFFADPLPKADVLIMGHILHDWDREQKVFLLKKAYAALPTGGAIVVYDMIIDDDRRQNALGLLMSLNMLIETTGGFDYTGADCIGWMREAGFRDARVQHLLGPDSMVIGLK